MLIRFFKSNQAASIIIIPLIALLMWVLSFFKPLHFYFTNHDMPLYELSTYIVDYPIIAISVAVFLVIIQAFTLNFIVNKHEILDRKSYLPAFFYVVLMSSCSNLLTLYPALYAHFFLLIAINRLLSTYRKETAFSQLFDAGLLIAISSLFYFPTIVFFIIVWVTLILFRPFIWREWIISFIGLTIPYYFVFAYYYWFGGAKSLVYKMFFDLTNGIHTIVFMPAYYALIPILLFIGVLSFSKLFSGLTTTKLKTKKALVLIVWIFICALITAFIKGFSIYYFSFFAIPFAISFAFYFSNIKKPWWGATIFFLLIVAILLTHLL